MNPFRQLRPDELDEALTEVCLPVLKKALAEAGRQHRLRVVDLPPTVMNRLSKALQGDDRWVVRMLCAGTPSHTYEATATKIIELRNTESRALLVFLPTGLRTAAEDSLDIATFQQIELGSEMQLLLDSIVSVLGKALPTTDKEKFTVHLGDFGREMRKHRVVQSTDQYIRYLLTWKVNGGTLEAAGRALFVFGLVPDPQLFERGPQFLSWLTRNIETSERVTNARQPLLERISGLKLRPGSIQQRLFHFVREHLSPGRVAWTAAIATDEAWSDLNFDRWPFEDAGHNQQVRLLLDDLPLDKQAADRLTESVPMKVWDLQKNADLKVSFRSIPGPAEVEAWRSYRIQILEPGEEAPTMLWESPNYNKPKKNARISRTVKASQVSGHLKEGVYYLRVDAYGADGAVLTHEPDDGRRAAGLRPENESELFLVAEGGVVVDPPKEPRAVFADSLLDAWFDLRGSLLLSPGKQRDPVPEHQAMTGLWDTPENASINDEVRFEVAVEGAQGRTVRVPGLLRMVEYKLLRAPEDLGGLRLDFRELATRADVTFQTEPFEPLTSDTALSFATARDRLFNAILTQHRSRNPTGEEAKQSGVVEVVDLLSIEAEILTYAQKWVQLCHATARQPDSVERSRELGTLARLDLIHLRWQRTSADLGRAALVAPTHPLRILWHLQHARVRDEGIRSLSDGMADVPDRSEFLDALDNGLFPTNLPLVLFDRHSRAFIEQDLLTPFWPLYLPAGAETRQHDVNHARESARRLLGVNRGRGRLGEIPPDELAERLFDYLHRHPYVEQLALNVFNPGEAERIADTLRALERRRKLLGDTPPELRYSVHLFSAKEHVERAGEALDALLDPERQVGEDDEFTLGATSHLRPKLLIARSTHEEFARRPEDFPAHVSILLEQFRVDGRLSNIDHLGRGAFVRGLVVESETTLEAQSNVYGWIRGVRAYSPPSGDTVEGLLVESAAVTHRVLAGASGGTGAEDTAPVIALHLDPAEQALLRTIHDMSDQVLTIDRNLGLDYFDSASAGTDFGYLLDFSPAFLQGDGERLLVTTRCTDELLGLIVPALETVGLKIVPGCEAVVIEGLRSISGRIALRLFAGYAATQEVMGLLLARWRLEHVGLLAERILVPIDAHYGWFGGEGSQQRADLLLVDIQPLTRTLDLTVVEVKARSHLNAAERTQLYGEMREQAENTVKRLREHFDLDSGRRPRADLLLRAKELFSLLRFYLGRAARYRLVTAERQCEIKSFLDTLDQGYRLHFRTRGVVIAADAHGSHTDEDEPGFPVYRFGRESAQIMLNAVVEERLKPAEAAQDISEASKQVAMSDEDVDSLRTFFDAPRRRARRPSVAELPPESAPPMAAPDTKETKAVIPPDLSIDVESPDAEEADELDPRVEVWEEPALERPRPALPLPPSPEPPPPIPPVSKPPTLQGTPKHEVQVDLMLGASEPTPQYGLLGRFGNAKVGLDLTGCNTVSLFGVQGFGKSYTLGVIAEMGAQPMEGINRLPAPLATVVFHYHRSDSYEPEYATAVTPNDKAREIEKLIAEYQARPEGLRDVVLLVPEAKLERRRQEYPDIEVQPIHFNSSEIGADGWKFLMGAVGNDSLYVRQIVDIMQSYGGDLTLADLEREIAESDFSKADLRLANNRLRLAKRFIRDGRPIRDILKPGRTIIVDMRDEWLEKEQALGLFLVLMHTFAQAQVNGRLFNKLMVFDEAHKYITESGLIGEVVAMIREMRHWATSVLIASQDPLSVPPAVLALTSVLVLHRITAPEWIKHLKKAIIALEDVSETVLANLAKGEALVWARVASDARFTQRPQKIQVRPRVTRHGGGTKTAVEGATVR